MLELRNYCNNITNANTDTNHQLQLFVHNNPKRTSLIACPVTESVEINNQFYECFFLHSRIGTDLSGIEQENYYDATDTDSVLPEDFFTNPELYSENAKIFDTNFLKKCGLVE